MERAGLAPDPWQQKMLISRSRRRLLCCSRQVGKSTVVAALALRQALLQPGTTVLVLSVTLRQSKLLLKQVRRLFNRLGQPVPIAADTAVSLELTNCSEIIALPGSEETIRGYSSVNLLAVDEAAFVDEDPYAAASPFLAVS